MKIAILTCADSMYKVFRPLMDGLKARGHECLFVSHSPLTLQGMEHPMAYFRWDSFNLKPLHDYAPDRVIIFNGRFNWLIPATKYIESKFKTVLCELAWFPQTKYLYFCNNGIAENSLIASRLWNISPRNNERPDYKHEWELLKKKYPTTKPHGFDISRPYVVIPLQMEGDTSIQHGSPYFKTMQSFIDWCSATAGDKRLVFKTHPRCPQHAELNFGPHEVISSGIPLGDLISYSKAVVGINSTSLIETLVYQKPIVQLGLNVFDDEGSTNIVKLHEGLSESVDLACERHEPERQKAVATYLALNQVEIAKPQGWAIDNILNYNFEPRK